MGLAFGGVGVGDGVDDGLGLFVTDFCEERLAKNGDSAGNRERLTLVVINNVAEMVATAVVGLAHAHGVVREVDIAIIAKDWRVC